MHLQPELHVLQDRPPGERGLLLEDEPDRRMWSPHGLLVYQDLAPGQRREPPDYLHQRALPAPARADDGDELVVGQDEVDPGQGLDLLAAGPRRRFCGRL